MIRLTVPPRFHGANFRRALKDAGFDGVRVVFEDERGIVEVYGSRGGTPIGEEHRAEIKDLLSSHATEPQGEEKLAREAEATLRELQEKIVQGEPLTPTDRERAVDAIVGRGPIPPRFD